MSFDFDAAVQAPFRMQPGLRRLAEGARQLTLARVGGRHQREKMAVFSCFAPLALQIRPGFDPTPALRALAQQAANEHPEAWAWDGHTARAPQLGVRVSLNGDVEQLQAGAFGLGDEIGRCLALQAPHWRLAVLLSLAFEEDFAIVVASDATIPWLAVALPSHWAPQEKVGRHFAEVHAPVADGELLRRASEHLTRLVSGPQRWERFVWNVTDQPRLHAHPSHLPAQRWAQPAQADGLPPAWFRTERQTFIPLPELAQSLFTIGVDVQPLAQAVAPPGRAAQLATAIASMTPTVLEYRGLTPVREALLAWLARRP